MSIVGKVNVAVLCCIRCYADVVTDLTLAPPAMGKINIEIKHQNRWSYKAYMKTVFCAHAWVCVCVCSMFGISNGQRRSADVWGAVFRYLYL